MRFFALLAIVAAVAAEPEALSCTEDMLLSCTPAFQFTSGGDCYWLDLAKGEFYKQTGLACTNNSIPYDFAAATKIANSSTPFVLNGDGLIEFGTTTPCPAPRRDLPTQTWVFEFEGAATNQDPAISTGCVNSVTLYTDSCIAPASTDGGSSRRNRASSTRRRNSASSTTNDNDRRSGCAEGTSPLFGLNFSLAPCQIGQCCGSNFCNRDLHAGDCLALGSNTSIPVFTPGHYCDDTTCKPVYPGTGSGAGGANVQLGSSLAHALGALPVGGYLEVLVKDVNTNGQVPEYANGEVLVSFVVNRKEFAGENAPSISGYLDDGTWIEITVQSDALAGAAITVWRWDETDLIWVDSAEDCAHINSAVEITVSGTTYTVPICHTSQFIVTLSADGDDKDDKSKPKKATKKVKVPTAAKPSKKAATKAPKAVSGKKDAKKGGKKVEVAVGVGVAGAAVVAAGVGFIARRRRNNNKKAPKATATATSEVAVVSV